MKRVVKTKTETFVEMGYTFIEFYVLNSAKNWNCVDLRGPFATPKAALEFINKNYPKS